MDTREFRRALGAFATGVSAVCAENTQGEPFGITVNSFTSVSLEPPLILVCLAKHADTLPPILETKHFSVNVLALDQTAISQALAQKGGTQKMASVPLCRTPSGTPGIAGAMARFDCRLFATYPGGDHEILVGEVLSFETEAEKEPLVYWRGAYRKLAQGDG